MNKKKITPDLLRKMKLHHDAQDAFIDYPSLRVITENLALFITPHFPGEKDPLIEECIRSAFDKFRAAYQNEESNLNPYKEYLSGLVSPAYLLLKKRICVETFTGSESSLVAWIPMETSVSDFLDLYNNPDPVVVNEEAPFTLSPARASIMLATRIMPIHDANLAVSCLCENEPEETID